MRTIYADIMRYKDISLDDQVQDESGWKLLHGDVFRAPVNKFLLSVLVSSGIQVYFMAVVTLLFSLLGFISPINRGSLMTAVVVLFLLMAFVFSLTSLLPFPPFPLPFILSLPFTSHLIFFSCSPSS